MKKNCLQFVIYVSVLFLLALTLHVSPTSALPVPGGSLDPTTIPKFVEPLTIPPAMPRTAIINGNIDYYEIAVRQFQQQILPTGFPVTTVWSYGSANHVGTFNYPAFTIEAKVDRRVRVKWINDLKNPDGTFLPHLLPVDQTIHWANPAQDCIDGIPRTDCRGQSQLPYVGPVPIVTHVHGAHTHAISDGHPEAWYLPAATDIQGYAVQGKRFDQIPGALVEPGAAVFQYPNDQPAATLWFHDHTLGMTRANVYAGPAGFFLLRGGAYDLPADMLPKPAPKRGDAPGKKYHEIPIAIQDRSFNADGSLFYPDNRAFFEGLDISQLLIPFIPNAADGGMSDVSPIWNPEFFGNTMVVNGKTWPYLDVEKRRYRFRFLNGTNGRMLVLKFDTPGVDFWQIGAEGGFLPEPVRLDELQIGTAERADVVVDFGNVPEGTSITLLNLGPDSPHGGGIPGLDFFPSDPGTTGQVMQFKVGAKQSKDSSLRPNRLQLPPPPPLGPTTNVRQVSLNEDISSTVPVTTDVNDNIVFSPGDPDAEPFGPTAAKLGILDALGNGIPMMWEDSITENPALNAVEIWEIHNFTEDAHPIHLHEVQFKVIERIDKFGIPRGPQPWEKGLKDTVMAYPGEVTKIKAKFSLPGLFVWHCHIIEHEDNEMMRPLCVGDLASCQ